MSQDTVNIIIDGVEIQATAGQTILEAADAAGMYIPRLCHHPDLPPGGHCRVCTVKVNGRPASSCTFPVSEGLVIENDTDEINAQRRRIIEMLFVEGNHYCPSCEAGGNCELQALGYRLGMLAPTLPYLRVKRELDATHKDVYIDRDRCVLCGRCVRASSVVDKKDAFGFENRGIKKRLSVDAVHGLGETAVSAADKAAQVCPTGCLTVKRVGYATPVGRRKYDKTPIGAEIEKKTAKV
ncbi:MAG TPA: 2Fe-2S iron-sulfur cluster-binding protein [Candidatus Hydrogenedentes bacterium]|nr:2Fe-2S iron-sulfur cluster-binding protein [Candidatus Hydrogenedentota bacterium]HNT86961.1 2Fe-2S iron-sulfur cluster-binding protein [Candidatus Hydrogenedentota bacterium]